MAMNSFSFRSGQGRSRFEDEVSELLNLHREGETFTASCFKPLKNLKFETVDLNRLKKPGWEDTGDKRRITPRYDISLTVLIGNYFKAFRTKSENISLSGILLKDEIPDHFCTGHFDVILIQDVTPTRKNYMVFRGRTIQTFLRTRRVVLESSEPGAAERLSYLFSFLKPSF